MSSNISKASGGSSTKIWAVFLIFLRLGLTSFGGPIAHLAYFRDEFVQRRRWLTEESFADLIAFCQFLPGPASSQLGMAIGFSRAGFRGLFAAWLGFTTPSAIVLILFAIGVTSSADFLSPAVLHSLKVFAVAIVAQAIWGMARKFCTDYLRIILALLAASIALIYPNAFGQLGIIMAAALCGLLIFKAEVVQKLDVLMPSTSRKLSVVLLLCFFLLLLILPLCSQIFPSELLALIEVFYRTGALVFGGGHVVLPLLQVEVVPRGWLTNDLFLAGYGAAQAVPGPLFTFSAFIGAAASVSLNSILSGIVCLLAIFLPSFLLIAGVLPFWDNWRKNTWVRAALSGVNAAVVGLLLAAFFKPVWVSAIFSLQDLALALGAFIALAYFKIPSWLVLILSGTFGYLFL